MTRRRASPRRRPPRSTTAPSASGHSLRCAPPARSLRRCDATTKDRRLNHSVRNALALHLPEAELPIPPYTLGVWLGDGTSAAAHFTTADPEIVAYVEARDRGSDLGNLRYGLRLPKGPAPTAGLRRVRHDLPAARASRPDVRQVVRWTGQGRPSGLPAAACPDCGGHVTRMGRARSACAITAPCRRCCARMACRQQAHPTALPARVRASAP